jgi:hypothetical protein
MLPYNIANIPEVKALHSDRLLLPYTGNEEEAGSHGVFKRLQRNGRQLMKGSRK